ncbi:hypothetical protein ABPG73_000513 [Tetrahymena malaccensis]
MLKENQDKFHQAEFFSTQQKSIQGAIYEDSIFNCLQGDIDDHVNSFIIENNLSRDFSQINQGRSNKIIISQVQQGENNEDQEDTETMSPGSQKSQFQQQELPHQQIENQNQKQNYQSRTQAISKKEIEIENSFVKNQFQDNQSPIYDNQNTSQQTLPKNADQQLQNLKSFKSNHINHQLSCTSAQNFEKAAKIVRNVLNKSMNRVERINRHVLNFIQFLKWRKKNRKLQSLQLAEKKIIKDIVFFQQNEIKTSTSLIRLFSLQNFFGFKAFFPVFMPTNSVRIYWDILIVFLTYLFVYLYSIHMFFNLYESDSNELKNWFLLIFIMFLVDLLINLNTAYFDIDIIITKRNKIVKKYITSTDFFIDIICLLIVGNKLISQILFIPKNNLSLFVINFAIFFKLNGIPNKKDRISHLFILQENQKHILRLLNQLFNVIGVAHAVCLAWYFLGVCEIQYGSTNSWLQKYNLNDMEYYEKYIYSLYWSITTMTTADEQKDRDQASENKILGILSTKLRNEITIEINTRVLNNYLLFKRNFSTQTLRKLVFIMEEVLVSPNEILFEQGDFQDQSIYLIEKGFIEIYQLNPPQLDIQAFNIFNNQRVHILKKLEKNNMFGEISFFSGLSRSACARSLNLSTLYKIDRMKFLNLIKENQEDFERFKQIEEQIKIQQDLQSILVECYICKNGGHITSNCPKVHQLFDKQFFILKNNFSVFQDRDKFERNTKRRRQNSIQSYQKNEDICKLIKTNLRNLNSQVEMMFKTESDILSNFSDNQSNYSNQDLESSQSNQSSVQEQISNQSLKETSVKSLQVDQNQQISKRKSQIQTDRYQKINSQFSQEDPNLSKINIKEATNSELYPYRSKSNNNISEQSKIITTSQQNISQRSISQEYQNEIIKIDEQFEENLEKLKVQQNVQKSFKFQTSQTSEKNLNPLIKFINNNLIPILSFQKSLNFTKQAEASHIENEIKNTIDKFKSAYYEELLQQTNKQQIEQNKSIKSSENLLFSDNKIKTILKNQNSVSFKQNTSLSKCNTINTNTKTLEAQNSSFGLKRKKLSTSDQKQFLTKQMTQKIQSQNQLFNLNKFKTITDSQLIQVDNFDKIQNFQKFFIHNNFNNIFRKQKQKRQNDNRKTKILIPKERRQNIFLSPLHQSNSKFLNNIIQKVHFMEISFQNYQPTYLSYGVSQRGDRLYPKINKQF